MSVSFEKISYPFYKVLFNDVPSNYFSLALFGHYGEINNDLYEKELENFKKILKMPDLDFEDMSISDNFGDEKLPKNAFLYSFASHIPELLNENVKLYEHIIEKVIEEKYSFTEKYILRYLSYYFNLGLDFFNSIENIIENIIESNYFHTQSEIKVKYYINIAKNKIYPIVKARTNGDIYRDYDYLDK